MGRRARPAARVNEICLLRDGALELRCLGNEAGTDPDLVGEGAWLRGGLVGDVVHDVRQICLFCVNRLTDLDLFGWD